MQHAMEADRVRAQLERILTSTAFADADRATSFLRFVVDRTLAERAGEIKESVIAVEVLGRPPSFDSRSDPIVRVEAGRLRDRLSAYYAGEGDADPVFISLPRWNQPKFSVSGDGVLLYQDRCAENHQLMWFDRQGKPLFAVGPPNDFLSFSLSSDERYVAFNRLEDPGTALPMIWDIASRPPHNIPLPPSAKARHLAAAFHKCLGPVTRKRHLPFYGLGYSPTRIQCRLVSGFERNSHWPRR